MTAIDIPIINAVVISTGNPETNPLRPVIVPIRISIAYIVYFKPNFRLSIGASEAKTPMHMTGTEVSKLTWVFDKDSCSRIVSSIGPIDVIAGRKFMDTAKIVKRIRIEFCVFI